MERDVEVLLAHARQVGVDDEGVGGLLDLERRRERGAGAAGVGVPREQVARHGEGVERVASGAVLAGIEADERHGELLDERMTKRVGAAGALRRWPLGKHATPSRNALTTARAMLTEVAFVRARGNARRPASGCQLEDAMSTRSSSGATLRAGLAAVLLGVGPGDALAADDATGGAADDTPCEGRVAEGRGRDGGRGTAAAAAAGLVARLAGLSPLAQTELVCTWALGDDAHRLALAHALAAPTEIVGARTALEHLALDPRADVRAAAAAARDHDRR
ncbi:MAG: hypothetical protein R2939_08000 [Kofleriaceae bacterium]